MNERGSSLVELLLAMMLIGVVAAFSIVKPTLGEKLVLENEAVQLASDLRGLQLASLNIARGHPAFTSPPGDSVPKMRFIMGPNGAYSISVGVNVVKRHQFSGDVGVVGNYDPITFNNDGYINQPISIRLSCNGQDKLVVIDRVGRIRIE